MTVTFNGKHALCAVVAIGVTWYGMGWPAALVAFASWWTGALMAIRAYTVAINRDFRAKLSTRTTKES